MNEIMINQEHENKTFNANIGDIITITLKENPTTGYRWTLMGWMKKLFL